MNQNQDMKADPGRGVDPGQNLDQSLGQNPGQNLGVNPPSSLGTALRAASGLEGDAALAGNREADLALERRVHSLLLSSLDHTNARVRSRLNRSRQRAVAAVEGRGRSGWLRWTLLPATGAVCAATLVAVFVLRAGPAATPRAPSLDASPGDVIELMTDDDALGLMENDDSRFYEWAAAQQQDDVGAGAGGGV